MAVALIAAGIAGCTKVDDTLGQNYIPDDQQMSIHQVVLGDTDGEPVYVNTYLMQSDSIPTSAQGMVMFGSHYSATFGNTNTSALIQMIPTTYTTPDLGYKPEFDSLYFNLSVLGCSGKSGSEETFVVYEAVDQIVRDSTYYASFPAEDVCDMTRPLFKFTMKGATGITYSKAEVTSAGKEYVNKLINTKIDYSKVSKGYQQDSVFIDNFHGLYIVPEQRDNQNGVYQVGLSYYYYSSASNMTLYFHNYEESTMAVDTTVRVQYALKDETNAYGSYPFSITKIEHSYPAAIADKLNKTDTPVSTAYIEGMGGVYTQLQFQKALMDKLNALRGDFGMSVNNATIYFEVENGVPAVLNKAFSRLGMYFKYITTENIPDYNYALENQSSSYTLPYGGYINRSSGGFYSMNITTHVQRMLKDPDTYYKRSVDLAPDVSSVFNVGEVPLQGSGRSNYKIKLKLTYSLIPK